MLPGSWQFQGSLYLAVPTRQDICDRIKQARMYYSCHFIRSQLFWQVDPSTLSKIIYFVSLSTFQQRSYSLITYVRPSVRMSGLGGNVLFSGCKSNDRGPIFFVQIRLKYEHLFCKYFFRCSAGLATKGRNVKILKTRLIY